MMTVMILVMVTVFILGGFFTKYMVHAQKQDAIYAKAARANREAMKKLVR